MFKVFFTSNKEVGVVLSIAAAARGSGIFSCWDLPLPSLFPLWAPCECQVPGTKGDLHADMYVYFCKWF